MKKLLLYVTTFALVALVSLELTPSVKAQRTSIQRPQVSLPAPKTVIPREGLSLSGSVNTPSAVYSSFHTPHMSPAVVVPGVDMLTAKGLWEQQSNGRALHNIQVDPSDPKKIHAVITGTENLTDFDKDWATRRCFYTFSKDGGKTWTDPVILQPPGTTFVRQGYADMVLMQRNGEYVPVIACHRYYPASSTTVWTALYVETGHAGDGKFSQTLANRTTASKVTNQDIIWPSIALSPDGNTVYAIASCVIPTGGSPQPLQFGTFSFNDTHDTAKFNGWTAEPGDFSGTPNVGLTSGGAYRIYVSPSGRIGVAWTCDYTETGVAPTSPTYSIFYSESTDGGVTWSDDPTGKEVAKVEDPDNNGLQWVPSTSFDFWYDGDNPKFVYERFLETFQDLNAIQYYPNSADLVYVDLAGVKAADIAHADTTTVLADGSDYPGALPQVMHMPKGSNIHPQGQMINQVTVARTPTSKRLAILYQSYADGDSVMIDNLFGDVDTLMNGSIYFSETTDGGDSWKDPQLWLRQPGFDLRYPQASAFNPMDAGTVTYHVLFSADSMAGQAAVGAADSLTTEFDINYFGHATTITTGPIASVRAEASAVSSLTISPNPFVSSTAISVTGVISAPVHLVVRDALGRDVHSFEPKMLSAGRMLSFQLDAKALGLTPGVYFVTAMSGTSEITRQAVVVK